MQVNRINEDRIEEIKKLTCEIMQETFNKNAAFILKDFDEHYDDKYEQIKNVFEKIFEEIIMTQQNGLSGDLQQIHLNYQNYCVIADNKLEVKVVAKCENMIVGHERAEISNTLDLALFNKYYSSDVTYLIPKLKQKIIRMSYREELIVKQLYAGDYYKLLFTILTGFSGAIQNSELLCKIEMEEIVPVCIGETCDEGKVIFAISK